MYGYLVPSSGGQSLPLRKTRLYMGRAKGSSAPLSRENAFCQLELIDGFWHIEDLNSPHGVKINGRACKRDRLMPDDEIAIGDHRYRISFEAPKYVARGKLAKSSQAKTSSAPSPDRATPQSKQAQTSEHAPGGVLGRLIPVGGGQEIAIRKPRVTIGRKPPCDIVLEYRSISSMHCGLELLDGYWQALDLDSRNGVRVDNVPIKKAWVMPKSRISLAEHRFLLDYVGVGAPPEDAREQQAQSDTRSLLDKAGLSEKDLERVRLEADDDSEQQRRWNVLDND